MRKQPETAVGIAKPIKKNLGIGSFDSTNPGYHLPLDFLSYEVINVLIIKLI